MSFGAGWHHASFRTRAVLVDRASRAISSAASTSRRSRAVPVCSSTSTTSRSSLAVPSFPDFTANSIALCNFAVAVDHVAVLACAESLLDGLREFRLAGVVRDPTTDLRRQRRVGGPHRRDETLTHDLLARNDTDPGGELLAADGGRFDLHLDVVVTLLGTPGAERVFAALIYRVDPAVCQVFDRRCDLLDEHDARAHRSPQPQRQLGDRFAHRGTHHRREVSREVGGIGNDIHRAQQRRGDRPQLVDLPIGPHSPAIAGEFAFAEADFLPELFGCLVLVLAVGEQDRVGERPRVLSHDGADIGEPGAQRGSPVGPKAVDGAHGRRSARCIGSRGVLLPRDRRAGPCRCRRGR